MRFRQTKITSIPLLVRILAWAVLPGVVLSLLFLTGQLSRSTTLPPIPPIVAAAVDASPTDATSAVKTATFIPTQMPETGLETAINATPTVITPTEASLPEVPPTTVTPSVSPIATASPPLVPSTTVPSTLALPTVVDPTVVPETFVPAPPTAAPPAPTPTETSVPAAPADVPVSYAPITRLVIGAIGVDAAVEIKSLDGDGVMQTASAPDIVSWYDFSSQPVDGGNVVFAGHLDYAGYGPAVFWRLGELQPGNVIEVYQQDGTIVTYVVTSVRPFAATDDASAVVASTGRPTITLITCNGVFDSDNRAYDERLVITGDRVD